jgi:hypothetical protein
MNNHDYPTIAHALEVCFSVQVGLSEEESIAAYRTLLENSGYASNLRQEIKAALGDPGFSWTYALTNPQYDAGFPADESSAREYVMELLWNGYFDD